MTLKVRVINPDEIVFEGEAEYVIAPTPHGSAGILPGHTPMFAELSAGEISIHGTQEQTITISAGLLRVRTDEVTILIGI